MGTSGLNDSSASLAILLIYIPTNLTTCATFAPYFPPRVVLSDKDHVQLTQSKQLWRLGRRMLTSSSSISLSLPVMHSSDPHQRKLLLAPATNRLLDPCRLATAKIVENGTTSHFFSPFTSLRVDLPTRDRHVLSISEVVIEEHQRYSTDSFNESTLCKHFSSGLPAPSPKERAEASLPAIPSPPLILPSTTPSLIVSIMDSDCGG